MFCFCTTTCTTKIAVVQSQDGKRFRTNSIGGVSLILYCLQESGHQFSAMYNIARSFYGCESFRTKLLKIIGFQLSRNQVFVGSFKRIKKIEDDAYPARSLKRKKHRITV